MILDLKGKLADVVPDAFVDLFSDEERFDEKKGSSAELDEALEALRARIRGTRSFSRCTRVIKRIINDGSVY